MLHCNLINLIKISLNILTCYDIFSQKGVFKLKVIGEKSISSLLHKLLTISIVLWIISIPIALYDLYSATDNIIIYKLGALKFEFKKFNNVSLETGEIILTVILLFILFQVRRILKNFSNGKVLLYDNVKAMRWIGAGYIFYKFAEIYKNIIAGQLLEKNIDLINGSVTVYTFYFNVYILFVGILIFVFAEAYKIIIEKAK